MTQVAKARQPDVPGGLPGDDPKEKFKQLKFLIHSRWGLGKTTLLSSAVFDPRTAPMLVLDFEGGSDLRFEGLPKDKYTIKHIQTVSDMSKIYNYLKEGNHPYKSVMLDSLTEIQKLGLHEFVSPGTKFPQATFDSLVVNVKTAEIQHWGKSGSQMGMLVRLFKDLPMHVFYTALTQTVVDETTKKVSYNVALPGKQADEVPGIPDIVGYIDVQKDPKTKKEIRVVHFQPSGRIVAKDRSDALGAGMVYNHGEKFVTKMLDTIYDAYGIK